jgi:hypothetical protein
MASWRRVALGLVVHTGRADLVAVAKAGDDVEVVAKGRMVVAATFDEGAVFHAAQEMPVETARPFVDEAERRFTEKARAEFAAWIAPLSARVVGAAIVAGPPKTLPPLETILKAHPLLHASEGELYRRVFAAAVAQATGATPQRIPPKDLSARAAAAARLTPARLAARLAAIGKASGRPWAADQKQAALAAWIALASA